MFATERREAQNSTISDAAIAKIRATHEAREIQCHRDCYGATTEAPRRALPYGSTDRLVHAAIKQGFADYREGRIMHVTGCTETR